ncbi:GNAT family N-acetyltransferase [Streptomyces roseifaciens]
MASTGSAQANELERGTAHVRRAIPTDAAGLARLRRLLYDYDASALTAVWDGEAEAAFTYHLACDADFVAFVVDLGQGQLASSAVGTLARRLPGPNPGGQYYGYIGSVATDPMWRQRGYGRAVVTAVMGWLSDQGRASVHLDASPSGSKLYEQLGFEQISAPVLQWQPQASEG